MPVGFVVVVAALLASVYYIRSRRAQTAMNSMNFELLAEVAVAKSRRSEHPTEEIEMGTTKQPAEIRRETIRAQARKEALNGKRQGA